MRRNGYNCPICLEPPLHPFSTTCGHIFCRKCMRQLFKVGVWGECEE